MNTAILWHYIYASEMEGGYTWTEIVLLQMYTIIFIFDVESFFIIADPFGDACVLKNPMRVPQPR